MGGACRHALGGIEELGLDAGELEPVGLLGIEFEDPAVQARQVLEVRIDRVQQLLVRPGQRRGVGQDGDEFVDHGNADPDGMLVMDLQDLAGDAGSDVRVAVAVAADPRAEADGGLLRRQRDAVLAQQLGEVRKHFRHGIGEDAVQVIDGVAGLVHGGGPDLAELVRLPHLVDHLGELAVLAAAGRGAFLRGNCQDVGKPADLIQDGAAGGFRGVGREDGADIQLVDHFLEDCRSGLAGDFLHGLGQPAVLFLPGPQAPDPVDLFGGVGQVEVERKSTDQVGGLVNGQGAEQFADLGDDVVRAPRAGGVRASAGRLFGLLGQQADLLDEVEELRAVLADQRFAQQRGDAPDIRPEFGREISAGIGTGRISACREMSAWIYCSVSHGNYLSRVRTWLVHCAGYCEPGYVFLWDVTRHSCGVGICLR
ncbi:hypothetical protein D9M72_392130 [compost metagenome]